jgi:CRISPR-associated protein Cas1
VALAARLARWFGRAAQNETTRSDDETVQCDRASASMAIHLFLDEGLLHLAGGRLTLAEGSTVQTLGRPDEMRLVCFHGRGGATTPALLALAEAGAPVMWRDGAGRAVALLSTPAANSAARRAQYAAAADQTRCLEIAKSFVRAKIEATREILRRRVEPRIVRRLAALARSVGPATTLDELRGVEGAAAAESFRQWPALIGPTSGFRFPGRLRHPPPDPVNALLSYGYAVAVGEAAAALLVAGLDPTVGFLHAEKPGRPALALDLVEPLRPSIVERAVLGLVNRSAVKPQEFEPTSEGGVRLSKVAKKALIVAIEDRWSRSAPGDAYPTGCDWRGALYVEAARLASALRAGASYDCGLRP